MKPFDFTVGGIEDGIIAALTPLKAVGNEAGYLKTLDTYSGQLDGEQLRRALDDLTPMMPAMLVAYGDGKDVEDPATVPFQGAARLFRHDCTFTVICLSDNARSEKARRRGAVGGVGVYRMIEDARARLGGLKLIAETDGSPPEQIVLNGEPLKYAGVEYLARLPELTAYAVHFDTWFRFSEPDRGVVGPLAQELIFTVSNEYQKGDRNLPGVVLGNG
jgi:phage gp37-like protein